MATEEIASVQELLEQLDKSTDPTEVNWYRGQRVFDWKLLPGYFRFTSPPSETTLLNRFRQNASRLLEAPARNDFDWLFLMQHYGVPTRLLDWSENPLTALYFAVFHSAEDDQDGALWMLNPVSLNEYANIRNSDEPMFIPSFDDEEIKGYSLESLRSGSKLALKPAATIATRNSARIQAQAGVFTIHHNERTPLEEIGDGKQVSCFKIPSSAKEKIRKQLAILGFTRFHLFPELESVGASVREGLE